MFNMTGNITDFWMVDIPYNHREDRALRKERREQAKARGFKTKRFEYRHGDEATSARQKKRAEAYAVRYSKLTNIELVVTAGSYL